MLKSSQIVLVGFFLTLCSCGGYWGGVSQSEQPNSNPPATEAESLCPARVEEAVIAVAEARTQEDKTTIKLQMQSCDTLKAAAGLKPQACATRFGEKIDLQKEADSCGQLVVQKEQILAQKQLQQQQQQQQKPKPLPGQEEKPGEPNDGQTPPTVLPGGESVQNQTQKPIEQKPSDNKPGQPPVKPEGIEQASVPGSLNVDSKGLVKYDDLRLLDFVLVPSKNMIGHVVSEKMAGSGDVVVRFSHKVDGRTEHTALSKSELVMPIAVGDLEYCGQSEKIDKDTLVSTKEGNVYKVKAAFENGQMVAALQTAPVGLKAYFPRTRLVDEEPIILEKASITGLPVKCNGDLCEGQQVMSHNRPDTGKRFIVQKIFCDGTVWLATDAWVTRSEFVTNQKTYIPVPAPATN